MEKEKRYLIVATLVAVLGGIIFYMGGKATLKAREQEQRENLIYCLLTQKVIMYGALGVPQVKEQQEIFGELFDKINYVECNQADGWAEECREKGINNIPTWSFPQESGIEDQLLSCEECQKKSGGIYCNEYCFEKSSDGKTFYVTGVMDLQTLSKLSGCQSNK